MKLVMKENGDHVIEEYVYLNKEYGFTTTYQDIIDKLVEEQKVREDAIVTLECEE